MKPSLYGTTHTVKLAGGGKIRVRRPSVLSLLSAGGFPQAMTQQVFKMVERDKLNPDDNSVESIREWATVMDVYLPFVALEPKISATEPTDLQEDDDRYLHGTLNIRDIQDTDKQTIFLYGNGVLLSEEELADRKARAQAAGLTQFRDGGARADAGSSGEAVRAEAIVDAGAPAA